MRYQKDNALYTERELRNLLPNVSLPVPLLPEHVAEFGFVSYDEPTTPPLSAEELNERVRDEIVARVQLRLDMFAATRGYDSILSACTYATDPHPKFAAEGQYCVTKRSETWAKMYQILDEVANQLRPAPTSYEEIEAELPTLSWPA